MFLTCINVFQFNMGYSNLSHRCIHDRIAGVDITRPTPNIFTKIKCDGTGVLFRVVMKQEEQYLLRTPINSSFLVCTPKITPTLELAL